MQDNDIERLNQKRLACGPSRESHLVPFWRTFTLTCSFLFLDPKWLILSLLPIGLCLIRLLFFLYPKVASQPEVKVVKSMARLAEQALMLVVISALVAQGMIYFIDILSTPESQLAASAVR